jgi:hypothetical protein
MKCKICDSPTNYVFSKSVLNKYDVGYHQCLECRFIQTDAPFWLTEAYSSVITSVDIGLLYRNYFVVPITSAIISKYYNSDGAFIDYGGGYGVFTRLMRDAGYNFLRQDLYCENIFANHFDISDYEPSSKYELLTAFEVFEHLVDPVEEIAKMLKLSDNLFFSTELVPTAEEELSKWWYIIPETGQHISFYTRKSLEHLAKKNGLYFYSNDKNLHLLTNL